ncbi:hypothetical protein [Enterobacter hormaechei]|uniref:hypothetical protein n=1 Tax=Enterobacter hormaechei TaxID=158836 RepID=UPI003F424B0B
MKSLSEQMVSIDRENFARIARGMPELPDAQDTPAEQTAEIFNALFSALRATFPASVHTEFKAIADKNVFPCVKCEVSFPHSAIRITTAQNACVIVVSAKEMEIHKACSRGFFGTNFEASKVGCVALSQTDVL